ncbi:hypothetical protein [Neptunomonas japonica]|uniref:hypothetical protein n=1 Tax=Neptunomonas japonica TaxID=417574 RepID=UPI00040FA745|nr:hypothetical protein [Neptunomonas japonica]
MRYVLVGVLWVWLSGCASLESSSATKVSADNVVGGAQLTASSKDELELYVYPQRVSEEAYVLRLKY